jgi:hypothetical protein
MRGLTAPRGRLGFEAFGTASGLAVVVGALSAVDPDLTILTATLAALAIAGWGAARGAAPGGRPPLRSSRAVAGLVALGLGGTLFLAPPPLLVRWRGLALGLGVVAFWLSARWGGPTGVRGPTEVG